MNLINLIIEGIPTKNDHTLKVNKPLLIFKIAIQAPFQIFNILSSQIAFLSAKGIDFLYIVIRKPHLSTIVFSSLLGALNLLFDKISELCRKLIQAIDFIFPKYYHYIQLSSKEQETNEHS